MWKIPTSLWEVLYYTWLRAEFAAKSTEEKARFESELAELRGELAAKIAEEKQRCETEKTQLAEEFAEERLESESENAQELERAETKLQQCQSTIDYMGGVMLQSNKVMLEEQTLLASHANTIQEANEEIKRQRNITLICEVAANTTALQSDTISLLRSSLSTALEFPQLSTKDLEQLDVAPFMLELMESYNKQTEMIENLRGLLEKETMVEDHMSEIAEGLANLTLAIRSASVNLDIVDQQAQLIQTQGKSIAQLTPLLRHTTEDIVWQEKTNGEVEAVSSCGCLPRSSDSNSLSPVKIEYHCGDLSNRLFFIKDSSVSFFFQDLHSSLLWRGLQIRSSSIVHKTHGVGRICRCFNPPVPRNNVQWTDSLLRHKWHKRGSDEKLGGWWHPGRGDHHPLHELHRLADLDFLGTLHRARAELAGEKVQEKGK